jgi:hypothetical protein
MKNMATLTAQSFFQHDVGYRMGNSLASLSSKKDFLSFVIVCMTCPAIGYGFDFFDNLVLNIQMTLIAFDFMGSDMLNMHEVCVIVFFQPISFPVAFVTVFSGNFSISDYGLAVAFVTFKAIVKYKRMIVS